jgi:hypothetical protein
MMSMTPKNFVFSCGTLTLAVLLGYLYLVNFIVIRSSELPKVYSQYLLETSVGIQGKVIVDSGSNSLYGIEPTVLAEYFEAPVIIIAQNAGYPLLPRIYNIAEHVGKGDMVILPLEWNMYVADETLSSAFLKGVTYPDSQTSYFYDALPAKERVRFILRQLPLANVFESLLQTPLHPVAYINESLNRVKHYRQRIHSEHRSAFGSIPSVHVATKENPLSKSMDCDNYVLGNQLFKTGFMISNEFRRALSAARNITDRGATVYFTWPAVVDSDSSVCYSNVSLLPQIEDYTEQIRTVVETAGFYFVGNLRDSRFPSRCYVDTHYHITETCAVERTQRLVKQFAHNDVTPINGDTSPYKLLQMANERLDNIKEINLLPSLNNMLPFVTKVKPMDFDSKILLLKGWHRPESWGVWSDGETSTLLLKIDPKLLEAQLLTISLSGTYYNGIEMTGVIINGEDFGQHDLTDKIFTVPVALLNNGMLRLKLNHHHVVSPTDLDASNDARKIKYGLTKIWLKNITK